MKTFINKQRIKMFLANNPVMAKVYFNKYPDLLYDETTIPYISVYYYNPKPYNDETIVIPLYITDFYQREYYYDDTSLKFKLRYEVDGVVNYINNLPAGDYNLTLGKLSAGMHWYSVQVEDSSGRLSKRVFNDILVVDRATYDITESQTYNITDDDLTTYSINKNNSSQESDMINNRVGLTRLFADLQAHGYRKCILPNGIYRVNRCLRAGTVEGQNCPIYIPTNFTVDLNGSTIKLHPFDDREYGNVGKVENLIIAMSNCHDSHLLNGTIEGDYFERKEMTWTDGSNAISGGNGEGNNTLGLGGGSFNSVENVTIKQTTGYNLITGKGYDNVRPIGLTWVDNTSIIDGNEVYKENYCTSNISQIPDDMLASNYMVISRWLGYGGLVGNYWIVDFHFYDSEQSYMTTIRGYQYCRCRIPEGSAYVRITMIAKASEVNAFLHHMSLLRYSEIKNCDFIDNRTCMAAGQSQFILIENLNFTRSGQSITPCCIDLEDGWEETQDMFFNNIDVLDNSTNTRELIFQAGLNIVMTNCKNARTGFGFRCHGVTAKNNDGCSFFFTQGVMVKPTLRCYDNKNCNSITMGKTSSDINYKIKIKNCKTNINTVSKNMVDGQFILEGCDINLMSFNSDYYLNKCNVYVKSGAVYTANNIVIKNSVFYPYDTLTEITFSMNELNAYRLYENCIFTAPTSLAHHNNFNSGVWDKCTFNSKLHINPKSSNIMGDIQFNNCLFKGVVTINPQAASDCYIQFNNCTFEQTPTFLNYGESNSEFNNCILP